MRALGGTFVHEDLIKVKDRFISSSSSVKVEKHMLYGYLVSCTNSDVVPCIQPLPFPDSILRSRYLASPISHPHNSYPYETPSTE